ncbi:hypothetical protein OGAPHI_003260 [Ogataea philodendri]|uniref:Uncharacterized protein n=1 Tax=Ogataea philodendri TaxID=1378263 RepID=A0A9P8T5H4_9ASCO|nr:uncharacterized protein OGAPHI_003260 [Ogataea philodendri]KAH3666811.1 hypothetical protein OGAPHI_003260 [Ogataea philodendri]
MPPPPRTSYRLVPLAKWISSIMNIPNEQNKVMVAQGQVVVGKDTLDLVELGQVRGIDGLVTENPVDREQSGWFWIGSQFLEHVRRNGGGVCSQHRTQRLRTLPRISVTDGAVGTFLVDLLDVFPVFFVFRFLCCSWVFQVEGVLQISGWMLLRNKQGVKVPETALHVLV